MVKRPKLKLLRPNGELGRQKCRKCAPSRLVASLRGFIYGEGLCQYHWTTLCGQRATNLVNPASLPKNS